MDAHSGSWMPVLSVAPAALLLPAQALLLDVLGHNLPDGWNVDVQADVGMAWAAAVCCAYAPSSAPRFTICGWNDHVGLIVHWMDGSAFSAVAFAELEPIVALIPSLIFTGALACLATVPAMDWNRTRH